MVLRAGTRDGRARRAGLRTHRPRTADAGRPLGRGQVLPAERRSAAGPAAPGRLPDAGRRELAGGQVHSHRAPPGGTPRLHREGAGQRPGHHRRPGARAARSPAGGRPSALGRHHGRRHHGRRPGPSASARPTGPGRGPVRGAVHALHGRGRTAVLRTGDPGARHGRPGRLRARTRGRGPRPSGRLLRELSGPARAGLRLHRGPVRPAPDVPGGTAGVDRAPGGPRRTHPRTRPGPAAAARQPASARSPAPPARPGCRATPRPVCCPWCPTR